MRRRRIITPMMISMGIEARLMCHFSRPSAENREIARVKIDTHHPQPVLLTFPLSHKSTTTLTWDTPAPCSDKLDDKTHGLQKKWVFYFASFSLKMSTWSNCQNRVGSGCTKLAWQPQPALRSHVLCIEFKPKSLPDHSLPAKFWRVKQNVSRRIKTHPKRKKVVPNYSHVFYASLVLKRGRMNGLNRWTSKKCNLIKSVVQGEICRVQKLSSEDGTLNKVRIWVSISGRVTEERS